MKKFIAGEAYTYPISNHSQAPIYIVKRTACYVDVRLRTGIIRHKIEVRNNADGEQIECFVHNGHVVSADWDWPF